MSVYVDPMIPCVPNRNWQWNEACHMIVDTNDDAELIAFAKRLGLKPAWIQKPGTYLAHFDLTVNKRRQALALGAFELTREEVVNMFQAKGGE